MADLNLTVEIQVQVDNRQRAGYVASISDDLPSLVRHALVAEGQSGPWSVTIVFVTDDRLTSLHAQFMGIDEETDVMTFPYDPSPFEPAVGGDIVISVDRATDNAIELDVAPADELRF